MIYLFLTHKRQLIYLTSKPTQTVQPEALNTLSDCLVCLQSMICRHLRSASLSAKISERHYFIVYTKNSRCVHWLTGRDKILVSNSDSSLKQISDGLRKPAKERVTGIFRS